MTHKEWMDGIKQLNEELNKGSLGIQGLIDRMAKNEEVKNHDENK